MATSLHTETMPKSEHQLAAVERVMARRSSAGALSAGQLAALSVLTREHPILAPPAPRLSLIHI